MTVGVLQTYVYVDQKSDPKRLVWTIMGVMISRLWLEIVSEHSLLDIVRGMLIGVSERVVVMSETGGEGVSRPGGNSASAGSAHTV